MAESSTMTCKDKATKKQKTKKEQKDINSMSDDFISDVSLSLFITLIIYVQ